MLDKVRALLEGEPARMISYGAVVVVWIVTRVMVYLNIVEVAPDFDAILVAVTAAIALVTETIRRFVYSPATVNRMVMGGRP